MPLARLILIAVLGAAMTAMPAMVACQGPLPCEADDECPANDICQDGACLNKTEGETGGEADGGDAQQDAGPSDLPLDAGSSDVPDAGGGSDPVPGSCVPNHDGLVEKSELPLVFDVTSRFIASGSEAVPVPVDLVGEALANDRTQWTFDSTFAGDRNVEIQVKDPTTNWAASDFPSAEYIAPLDPDETHWGFYERTDDALLLLGLASTEVDRNRITYDPPLVALPYPVQLGHSQSQTISADGIFEYNPYYSSSDTYQLDVDGTGEIITPAGTYSVLRVRIQQTIRVPILVWPFVLEEKQIIAAFVTECLGAVVHVRSAAGEEDLDFTESISLLRLGGLP
jgi:hypothetical protein